MWRKTLPFTLVGLQSGTTTMENITAIPHTTGGKYATWPRHSIHGKLFKD